MPILPNWIPVAAAWLIISGCIFDIWLVMTGRRSISLSVWLIEKAHPTIIVGVVLLGIWSAHELYSDFWLVVFVLIATGHFITTEGAAIAMTTYKNWKLGTTKEPILSSSQGESNGN